MAIQRIAFLMVICLCSFACYAHGGHGGHSGHGGGHGGHGGHCAHGHHGGGHVHSYHGGGHYHAYDNGVGLIRYSVQGTQEFVAGTGAFPYELPMHDLVTMFSPSLYFTYRYGLSRHLSLGFSAGTYTCWGTDTASNGNARMSYNYKMNIVAVAADMKYTMTMRNMQVYTGLTVGLSHYMEYDIYSDGTTNTQRGYSVNGQLTVIGVRVGRSLAVYGEFGIGYKGILAGGLSYIPNYSKMPSFSP